MCDSGAHKAALPGDVVQILLGHASDSRQLAAARQACKAWRRAAFSAACSLKIQLSPSSSELKHKLALLHQVVPALVGCQATFGPGTDTVKPTDCFTALQAFQNMQQLDITFTESQELSAADVLALASLTGLTSLHLASVCLPATTDASPLTQLQGLQDLSLIHHSKVSALLVGDQHLAVLGQLHEMRQLVLQGRMCSATDAGLLFLRQLSKLTSLSMGWVPWQTQITQHGALKLLAALKSLRSLQLGGAELLLPTTPYYPAAAATAPPTAPGSGVAANAAPVLGIGIAPQGAIAAVMATVAAPGAAAGGLVSTPCVVQGEHMRKVLGATAGSLEIFKLQFNYCGTGVEKALLCLGELRHKLTGLQWSYAKLSGSSSVSMLGCCTNLRSLKLRLWYQDYNLAPFEFKLLDLSKLVHLKTLAIDKRPPFQQQLPAQQAAISLPVRASTLTALTGVWTQLEKLQLGLARSDFGPVPLEGLAGFTQLKNLSVHCYDQGYDDGQFMLPVDIALLPMSLVKLDLMHAELFNNSSSAYMATVAQKASSCSSSKSKCHGGKHGSSSSTLKSYSSSIVGVKGCAGGCSSGNSASANASSSSSSSIGSVSRPAGRATAITSMLSESFSMLSRQASADCSRAFLDQMVTDQHRSVGAAATTATAGSQGDTGLARTGIVPAAIIAAAKLNKHGESSSALSTSCGVVPKSSSGWLHSLLGRQGSSAASIAGHSSSSTSNSTTSSSSSRYVNQPMQTALAHHACSTYEKGSSGSGSTSTSTSSGLSRQLSLPPLPRQQSLTLHSAPQLAAKSPIRTSPFASQHNQQTLIAEQDSSLDAADTIGVSDQGLCSDAVPKAVAVSCSPFAGAVWAVPQTGTAAAAPAPAPASPHPAMPEAAAAAAASRPARLQNPFAATAAAAAVHAAVGGCVAAVEPAAFAAGAAISTAAGGAQLLPVLTEPMLNTAECHQHGLRTSSSVRVHRTPRFAQSGCSSSSSGGLQKSFSTNLVAHLGSARTRSKAAAALAAATKEVSSCSSSRVAPRLPLLQHLQLKHCTLDTLCLDAIVAKPAELRCLQLVEVSGLTPRDIALIPLLSSLQHLALIASREDAWLGLAPLRLLSKLPVLRHLDWVVSERALPARHKGSELEIVNQFPKLQLLTLHTALGKCDQLHALSVQLQGRCHVRLMTPAYCEHAGRKSSCRLGRLLSAASCLLPGS